MKVLHINTSDINGGAARAAYRLHHALLNENIDSQMLVQTKASDDYTVIGPESRFEKGINLFRPFVDSLPVRRYKNRTQSLFSPAWLPFSQIPKKISQINPDIVHLHWICGGMIRIEDLTKIKQPIVWSLHDMWAFTGGEHIDEGQEHFINQCGNSKVLNSQKENDLSRKVWLRKKKTYSKLDNITIIGLSRWMYDNVQKSSLLKNKNSLCLPNPINTKTFSLFDKGKARELLNLPKNKKIILFGAMSATKDPNKGFNYILQALNILKLDNIELIVFGSSQPKEQLEFKYPIHYMGHLHDDISLKILYNAVDVMIVPSKQEAFGQTAVEAMACGLPVVAFQTSGLRDIITHQQNGYLATPFKPEDLAFGIEWVLNNDNYQQLCDNARNKVLTHFDSKIVAQQYIELYKEILSR